MGLGLAGWLWVRFVSLGGVLGARVRGGKGDFWMGRVGEKGGGG